jgi:hypothetical protein
MNMMIHRRRFSPAVARTPGGSDHPVAVGETFPPLPSVPAGTVVTVGVIDTGLVLDEAYRPHPWFGDHVSFGEQDDDPLQQGRFGGVGYLAEADGHGTFVTGLILREAPRATVTMRGVLDKGSDSGDGLGADDDTLVAEAVCSLAQSPTVQVINLSFGGGVFTDAAVPANLGQALQDLDPRIAVVAAAGNDGCDREVWPAAFPRVISVGALDERRLVPPGAVPPRAPFSNYGKWVRAYAGGVQLLGPFVDFEETGSDLFGLRPAQRFRGWARWSGTSFAAATVSGRIAQTVIELGVTGTEAADIVLADARTITDHGAVWIRGNA